MMNMTTMQTAWAIYFAGALGCTIAAWWMFLWSWRFIRYAAVVTVMTLLFTPYAIDPQTMTMAPAIYTLVFDGVSLGLDAIKPLLKLMGAIWSIAMILVVVFLVLTRRSAQHEPDDYETDRRYAKNRSKRGSRDKHKQHHKKTSRRQDYHHDERKIKSKGLSDDEYDAREELLKGEIPIRAIRD